jgi:pentatricopeptide repeat protein
MGLRQWFRERMLDRDAAGDDVPPRAALMNTLLGRDHQPGRSLGDYDSKNYPADLRELLIRREEVARELLGIEVTNPEIRVASIPKLRELLRRYPHPLVYETLIHACLDAGRVDEARGVAFAARQRRIECAAAEYPEIRAEIESLHEWTSAEIEELGRS